MSEWFEEWFGEEYLGLYLHRDAEDAERLVRLLDAHGVGGAGQRVLDVACGPGRHAPALGRRGATVVGLDLSWTLLLAARRRVPGVLVRGDMRCLPFAGAVFDAALNLFTSFGYFADDAENHAVLREVARVLRPGGSFVLDFLNAPAVRAGLVPRDERRVGERTVVQERRISEDGRFVTKSIHVHGDGRTFSERVRLFERAELERTLAAHGIHAEVVFGDYNGTPHGPASPRLIILGRRS